MVRQLQTQTGKQGLCFEVNEWLPQAFIQNAGGDVIDGDGKPVMDSAAAVKGIEAFVQPRRDNLWRVMTIPEMVAAYQAGAIGVMARRRRGPSVRHRQLRPPPDPDAGPRRPAAPHEFRRQLPRRLFQGEGAAGRRLQVHGVRLQPRGLRDLAGHRLSRR